MECPTCNVALIINERQGVDVDQCPTCHGVWLNRGKLDQFIARTQAKTTQFCIPSVSSQKQEQFKVVYEGTREHSADETFHQNAETNLNPERASTA